MNGIKHSLLCLSLGLCLTLTGCSVYRSTSTDSPPLPAEVTETGSFAPDTLFDLLLAEMAGQREQYALASERYLKQAELTRDPGVIQRSLQIAQFINHREAAFASAALWVEVQPHAPQAHESLALEQARAGLLTEAMLSMQQAFERGGNARFGMIAGQAEQLSDGERQQLLALYDQLLADYPDQPNLLLGKAVLLQQSGQLEDALALLAEVARLSPENNRIPQLQARLLHETGRDEDAAELLGEALDEFPEDIQLRLIYARVLVTLNRFDQAQRQFEHLLQNNPYDSELLLSAGLVALENNQLQQAQDHLEQLVQNDPNNATGYFYLGQLAEERGETTQAITYYRLVNHGQEYLTAKALQTQLLLDRGDATLAHTLLEEARAEQPALAETLYLLETETLFSARRYTRAEALADKALQQYPNSTQLLYVRAMLAEKRGRLDLLEKDLRQVIALEPNNAAALNALGYTLADRTDRLTEARALIEQAYRITPDDPAVIDSKAWVLYRLGDHQQALDLLARAFALMPDHEIAAHYGELLWVNGYPEEAKSIWQQGFEHTPDSEVLQKTVQRFLGQSEL